METCDKNAHVVGSLMMLMVGILLLSTWGLLSYWKAIGYIKPASDIGDDLGTYHIVSEFKEGPTTFKIYRSPGSRENGFRSCELLTITDGSGHSSSSFNCESH